MSISSDEINFLIYRYLQENGFSHSAFTFSSESLVSKSSVFEIDLPPGSLITFLQKGLEYIGIEENICDDGTIREFDSNYTLLSPFVCDSLCGRDGKRVKRKIVDNSSSKEANIIASNNNNNSSTSSSANRVSESEDANCELSASVNGSSANEEEIISSSTLSQVVLKREAWSGVSSVRLPGHRGEAFMCVWSPRAPLLASGSADGLCRLWDLNDLFTHYPQLPGQTNPNHLKLSSLPDNANLQLKTFVMPHASIIGERFKDITSITWSPDGKFIATGCYTGEARIWDSKGNLKLILKEHTGPVFSLKWNKLGNYLLSGSYDRRTIVWSPETGQIIKSYLLHSQPVLDVDWRDSDVFASCSSDREIHICRVSSSDCSASATMIGHRDEVNAVVWAPGANGGSGAYLASCSDDTTAKIWSLDTGLLFNLKGHAKEIFTLRWTPLPPSPGTPLYLCTASFDGTVKIWDGLKGSLLFTLARHSQPVYSVSPSPLGSLVATGSLGGHVTVWSLKDGSLLHEMKGPGDTFDVSWSSDGSLLSACFSSGNLIVQDTQFMTNGEKLNTESKDVKSEKDEDGDEKESEKQENSQIEGETKENMEIQEDERDERNESFTYQAEEVKKEIIKEEDGIEMKLEDGDRNIIKSESSSEEVTMDVESSN